MNNEVESRQLEVKAGSRPRKKSSGSKPRAKNDARATETDIVSIAVAEEAGPEEAVHEGDVAGSETELVVAEEAHPHAAAIEAVLLSVDRPVSAVRMAEALGLMDEESADRVEAQGEEAIASKKRGRGKGGAADSPMGVVRAAIAHLNEQYAVTGRAFRIESVAGGFRLMTLAKFAGVIEDFLGKRERTSLSRAAVETLAIVAYKQPLTRASLEAIRGVACGEVLKTLLDRRLVTITGRAEELGRPMLYGTTRQFLAAFGLATLRDLPSAAEFKARHAGGDRESND